MTNQAENKTSVFWVTLKWTFLLFVSTIGVLIGFGLVLGYLEGLSNTYLYSAMGWAGIVLTGIIGTPIHELSHYVMCLVFGFRVHEVKLFQPIEGMRTEVLGYVSFSRNPESLWQTFGTLFVGIAPMVLGPMVILLLFRLMLPQAYKEVKAEIGDSLDDENITLAAIFKMAGSSIKCLARHLFHFEKGSVLRNIIFLYLVMSISTHTTLSTADIKNSLPGLLVVLGIFLIMGFLTALSKVDICKSIMQIALLISAFFVIALLFSVIATILSYGIFCIRNLLPF